ncbi:(Fe-S)-binding protein [uncultured Ilumatobacter sp.]|uniref:(Fe-S)-binding protein n=1 Tax=uncultured Ilumatobacter sp. TaxID=879968 RepID=UPI00374E7034
MELVHIATSVVRQAGRARWRGPMEWGLLGFGVLEINPDKLSTCVSCGLCLPHCPTFRVTGEESYSPRGRIDAMRAVESGELPIDETFVDFMETCVQCRGCEPACPSGVQFGSLMEDTRSALAAAGRITPRWQRIGFWFLDKHRLLLAGSSALAIAQRMRLVPKRLGLSGLPIRRPAAITSTGTDVWLFTGCVMDAWQRSTHVNTAKLIAATGATYAVPGAGGGCCGALHVHAGLTDETKRLAIATMASMPGEAPIVVNSAGCGAAMKDYGHLLGTPDAQSFSARVVDVNEYLAERVDRLPVGIGERQQVIVQDPCHLRHVQRVVDPVRMLLGHVADVVELDDDGLCCGAGGAYSALQPELAGQIRERKVASISRATEQSSARLVASANPGCSMHLTAVLSETGLTVMHPVDIVATALQTDG